jgi:alkanesulfonate monooxygenase SsuD/methylene tetrahydromethanopterin reductase-like flavin-dependent oxidoreductase (luciferase family)
LLFGIGGGWNAEEMAHHGTPFQRRWKVLRERIEAMKAIWSQEAAEYHGEFVNFDPVWSYPKPLQQPHPPILLGTLSTQGLQGALADSYGSLRAFYGKNFWQLAAGLPSWGA